MQNKLYVGNLSYSTTEDSLRTAFEGYGEVTDVALIKDRETGRPRGFGFVTFAAANDAETALGMNGQELDGRTLRVNIAQEKKSGGSGGGYGGRGGRDDYDRG